MGIRNQKRNWNRVGIEINFCLFFSQKLVHEYVTNILEKKIALVSLAIIMVLTGVTFGIGFGFQKHPQLLPLHPLHLSTEYKIMKWQCT